MFTLRTVESLKGEVVSLCNANLEFLKKICLDMATSFEGKLVESFSNQSKTTADILHENHQVLNVP